MSVLQSYIDKWARYYAPLIGATIEAVRVGGETRFGGSRASDHNVRVFFDVRLADGRRVQLEPSELPPSAALAYLHGLGNVATLERERVLKLEEERDRRREERAADAMDARLIEDEYRERE